MSQKVRITTPNSYFIGMTGTVISPHLRGYIIQIDPSQKVWGQFELSDTSKELMIGGLFFAVEEIEFLVDV